MGHCQHVAMSPFIKKYEQMKLKRGKDMKQDTLFSSLEFLAESTFPEANTPIKGIAYHTKNVKPGYVFVCIKGYKVDGHRFLHDAIEKGAIAAVVETPQSQIQIPQIIVKDSRKALALLGDKFYGSPSKKMQMIGITATNGKTTTSYMTNSIFKAQGLKTGLIGTVAVQMDGLCVPSDLTTPESLDLHYYFNEMANAEVSHLTMEVSSSALELNRVYGISYDIVSMNNISPEHIDTHGSFEKYFHFKSRLIRHAENTSAAVLNLDCPLTASLKNQTAANLVTFGVENKEAHILCENLDLSTGRAKFDVVITQVIKFRDVVVHPQKFSITLAVPGLHSVYNAMSAISIALISGISPETIQKGIYDFKGVERRFEFIFEDDFIVIDDHFANAGNIDVTLKTLDFMKYKNLHLVYAIRGSRGVTVNRENAEAIVKWAKPLGISSIIATLSRSVVTSKDFVTDDELKVFLEVMNQGNIEVDLKDELTEAVEEAISHVKSGDLILLAGCQGMDFGGEEALKQLHVLKPHIPQSKLFKPLKTRVAGIVDPTVY